MEKASLPDAQVPHGLLEHAWIDRAFRELTAAVDHPGTGDIATLFQAAADRLRSHLAREELDISRFADVAAADARALLHDHAELRQTLETLAAQVKLGQLSKAAVHDLKMRVTFHEAAEETSLYRWMKGG